MGEPVICQGYFRIVLGALRSRLWGEDHAAQMVEFAVALPLLVLFVVGIFDFSGAFTLKQKLTNIARDAARVAASDPSNDIASSFASGTAPASVVEAYNLVHNDLAANQINDCGMTATSVTSAGILTWQYRVIPTAGAPCGITLTINRGYTFPSTSTALPSASCASQAVGIAQTATVTTCVSLQYNYAWKFGGVSRILGANMSLPAQIAGVAVAVNEN